ncbi:tripartite tricarboxylate transporter permease [Micromonospora sp. NPDC023966]|uniref:tripartite tricarboxylate transporter permease n=1 Tax=Micromonospora sp. NPDC023966 TaxID=3154699 RepID=UPI0033FFDDFD
MVVGVALGFVVGILPGLGGAVTLALLLPFTFSMDPVPAFALLLGMYVVAATAGDITSVLFGVPGEASSAAVVLDGYPMTRRGRAGRALGAVLTSSGIGALVGAVVLVVLIPLIRPIILNIGPPEFFALAVLGLTFVVTLSSGKLLKGALACLFGVLVSLVGLDPATGSPRFTFGLLELWDGISIVPVVIGLFGGAEVLQLMMQKGSVASTNPASASVSGVGAGVRDALRRWPLAVRSGAIGTGLSLVPGMGGSVAQFVAYGHAKSVSKNPEEFGKGSVEGVVAAGATGVAKDCGSLIPTVAFGIPGSASSAVLLSAFLILGLDPGKEMLTTELDVTMSMVWIALLATVIAIGVALALVRPLAKLSYVSGPLLIPFLLLLLSIGAFTENNSWTDVLVMLAFVVVGVACIRWDWPRVPLLLGFVLGEILERYIFLSNSLFGAAWITRTPVLAIGACIVAILASHFVRERRAARRLQMAASAAAAGPAVDLSTEHRSHDREGVL